MQKFLAQYQRLGITILLGIFFLFAVIPSVVIGAEDTKKCGKKAYSVEEYEKLSDAAKQEPNICVVGRFISSPECACCGACELNDFIGLGINVVKYIFGISGSLALLMFIYGGFKFLTAAGNKEQIESGKTILTNAVYGIIIIFGAWVLINFVLMVITGQTTPEDLKGAIGGTWWQAP